MISGRSAERARQRCDIAFVIGLTVVAVVAARALRVTLRAHDFGLSVGLRCGIVWKVFV